MVCRACLAAPAVSEIARLVQSMLPADARIPGALRYTLARALLEVDARPFDSLDEMSATLARHEDGDRRETLRALWQRCAPPPVQSPAIAPMVQRAPVAQTIEGAPIAETVAPAPVAPAVVPASAARTVPPIPIARDRRLAMPSPDELRRHLRQADVELFHARSTAPGWALGGAIAVLVAFGVGYAVVDGMRHRGRASSPAPAPIAIHQIAPTAATTLAARSPLRRVDAGNFEPAAPQPAVVRAVSRDVGPAFSPSFESSGTALFFHTGRSTDASSGLQAVATGDSGLRVMTILDDGAKNYHVQPSPDGTRVAFDSDRDGERGVYIANRDGTEVRRISGDGYAAVPTWSPDGTQLAFIRGEADRPRVWNLWLMNLKTGAERRLTGFKFGQTWSASWFADGRRVAYTHEDRLFVADLMTGATRDTPHRSRERSCGRRRCRLTAGISFSRSGAAAPGCSTWRTDRCAACWRIRLPEEFAWSPDGRRIAFHRRRDGQWGIWLLGPA